MRNLLLACVVLSACGGEDEARTKLLAQIKSGPFVYVTARELANAYATNDLGGDKEFRGKVLRVAGHFGRSRRDGDHVVVLMWGEHHHFDSDRPGETREVACDYIGDEAIVAALEKDHYVTAHGLGAGASNGLPLLANCVLEPP